MAKLIDLVGQTFGDLTTTAYAGLSNHKRPKSQWVCLCTCGNTLLVLGESLRTGHTTSCGCRSGKWKHGHCKTVGGSNDSPTYMTWVAMKNRCNRPTHTAFERYGAKGVDVCSEWLESFETFLADMGERPNDHTIDRIDNTKGYSPSNCRWATQQQQYENKRVIRNSFGQFTKG